MQPNYSQYQQQQQQQQQQGIRIPPPNRRPSPYDQRDQYGYNQQPQTRPLPPDPPPPQYQPKSDPYAFAFEQPQSHRPAGSFYPEAHLGEPRPTPAKSPDIVSPRPQRLTPSMPANLAQNLDQQESQKSNSTTPRPPQSQNPYESQYESAPKVSKQPPQLPPLDPSIGPQRRQSDDSYASSQYSLPSGVDEYLKSDSFVPVVNQSTRPQQQPISQPVRQNPYDAVSAQPPKPNPYSAYVPQPAAPPAQPPYVQDGRPRSSSQSQGKPQYPLPPPQVNYANRPVSSDGPPSGQSASRQYTARPRVNSGGSGPYELNQSQTHTTAARPRINSGGGSQDRFDYNQPQSQSARPPQRPYSQDLSRPLSNSAETTPRNSVSFQPPPEPDFIDMPDAGIANLSLNNDPYPPPPRPVDQPLRSSPQLGISPQGNPNILRASPPPPLQQDDLLVQLESERDTAVRTTNADAALTWAEKVYMYVSISLEELRREREGQQAELRPSTPLRERQLRTDCVGIVEKFVRAKYPKAIYMKGIWCEYGDFRYSVDRHEAYRAYEAAAKLGYARAEYRIGKMYEDVGDLKRGIKHYERGVALEDSASLYRMGMLKLLGQKGYPADIPGGVNLLFRSAAKADLDAPQGAYVFALLLAGEFNGVNVPESILPRDEKSALRMLEKASSLGFSHAQQKLGAAYENGTWGCGYDPQLSLHYYTLAAKQGDAEAMMGLSKWYLCGGEGFSPNEELAYKYADRAAKAGLPQAEFAMGYFYEVGIYVQPDIKVAEAWYKQAAAHGNKESIQRREGISRNKTLSRKDHETITGSIRANRLKKGQRASNTPVPTIPEQYNEAFRAQAPYATESIGRTQSPGRQPQARYSTGPAPPPAPSQGHGRTYSGSGPQPKVDRPSNRHSSYGGYPAAEYNQDSRKSSYGQYASPSAPVTQSSSQPSLASLANAPDDNYSYSAPTRPQTGSRPASQGSLASLPPTSQPLPRPEASHGSGPKTFQEMGVDTRHKKDSDCLIM